MSYSLTVNGESRTLDLPGDMPLLWALRDGLNLTGTKYGCGVAACGVLHGPHRWCRRPLLPDARCRMRQAPPSPPSRASALPQALHAIQAAWLDAQVAQCGYCQSGQIMQAASLLSENPAPTDAEIDEAMSGNLCRCGTYPRIRAAIHDAARRLQEA